MTTPRHHGWLVPLGLVTLALIPIAAGGVRLSLLAAGGPVDAQNARFFDAPVPVLVHIVSVTIFSLLAAFQFAPGLRRRWPAWHRAAGRVVAMAAFGAAFSGLWMAGTYAIVPADSDLLHGLRLLAGWGMVFATTRGLMAILGGNVESHQAWMRRAYAIGLGAGTQALILGPAMLMFGQPDDMPRALMMGAGWVLNLVVAESLIRAPSLRGLMQWPRQDVVALTSLLVRASDRAPLASWKSQAGRPRNTECCRAGSPAERRPIPEPDIGGAAGRMTAGPS